MRRTGSAARQPTIVIEARSQSWHCWRQLFGSRAFRRRRRVNSPTKLSHDRVSVSTHCVAARSCLAADSLRCTAPRWTASRNRRQAVGPCDQAGTIGRGRSGVGKTTGLCRPIGLVETVRRQPTSDRRLCHETLRLRTEASQSTLTTETVEVADSIRLPSSCRSHGTLGSENGHRTVIGSRADLERVCMPTVRRRPESRRARADQIGVDRFSVVQSKRRKRCRREWSVTTRASGESVQATGESAQAIGGALARAHLE